MEEGSIVITGASGHVGRATIEALVHRGVRPTALVRKDVALPGCAVIPEWLTSNRAIAAVSQARTVVHLAGALNPADGDYERANLLPARRVAGAVKPGQTHRLIFLSYVGAAERSRNPYLATKARAERVLKETRVPLTVFRCTEIIGSPQSPGPTARAFLAHGRHMVRVLGSGKQRVAPVYVGDVVAAIEAAIACERDGTFDLQGPDEMSFDDLVHILNRSGEVPIRHIPALIAPLLHFFGPRLPLALIDIMTSDSESNHPSAQWAFELSLRHLDQVWASA